MENDSLDRFIRWRGITREQTLHERGDSLWDIYDQGLESYQTSFNSVLGERIEDLLVSKKSCIALDLMGQGQVLRDLKRFGLYAGIAVSLTDNRSILLRVIDQFRHIGFVEGGVQFGVTWKEIKDKLCSIESDRNKFDIILCRPAGGLGHITKLDMAYVIFERIYKLLSSNNGILITQIPPLLIEELTDTWIYKLEQIEGIEVRISRGSDMPLLFPSLYLVKSKNAPERINEIRSI